MYSSFVEYEVKEVNLLTEELAAKIPQEFILYPEYRLGRQDWVLYISRMVAELDEKTEKDHLFQPVEVPYKVPATKWDYLKFWLTSCFPLLTAPIFQPRYVTRYASTTVPLVVQKKVVEKVVAPRAVHGDSYRYVKPIPGRLTDFKPNRR